MLGEDAPNLRTGTILIVGRSFDNDRHPAWAVAFIHDLLEVLNVFALAGAAFDGTLDVIVRHALRSRNLDRAAQTRIAIRITPAGFRGDGDFLRQLAEDFAASRVNCAFETLDLRPFAMSRHKCGGLLEAEIYLIKSCDF